jgi:hypothetical protein
MQNMLKLEYMFLDKGMGEGEGRKFHTFLLFMVNIAHSKHFHCAVELCWICGKEGRIAGRERELSKM